MLPLNTIIRKTHLWLGLTCGLIASFSGLTGSLYVWQPEITALLNPHLLKVKNISDIDEATILKSAATLTENLKDSIDKIYLPYREQQTISILFKNGKTNYYHPVNYELLGSKSTSISFFENLLNLHRTLGIPKIGKYIVGTSAVLFFLFILTSGIYIWWKTFAHNFRKGFNIKWKSRKKKFNFDLHKVSGIYFFTPLFVIAFTGAYFTYNTFYKSALKIFDEFKNTQVNEAMKTNENFLEFSDVLKNSNETYALSAIYFPKDSTSSYRFRYIKDRFIKAGFRKTKEVELSPDGKTTTLSDFKFDTNSNRIAAQFYPIHIGEIAGLLGRVLVFISGFVPILLFITGFKVYKRKCKRA